MKEQITVSPEYTKAFNAGYLMEKELPDLAGKLSSAKSDSERTQGFQDGRKQYVIEKAREQRLPSAKDRQVNRQIKSKDLDRDIDA